MKCNYILPGVLFILACTYFGSNFLAEGSMRLRDELIVSNKTPKLRFSDACDECQLVCDILVSEG